MATTLVANGSKILIKLTMGGTEKLLAGQISGSHDLKVDVFETTSKSSANGAKTYEAGEHTITYKVDCVVDPADSTNAQYTDVFATVKAKTAVAYKWGGIVSGDKIYTGNAIITGLSQSAPKGDKISFSIDLQVTGDETEGTVTI